MLRFIIARKEVEFNGLITERFYTVDANVPELEDHLYRGGVTEDGIITHTVKDVELLPPAVKVAVPPKVGASAFDDDPPF